MQGGNDFKGYGVYRVFVEWIPNNIWNLRSFFTMPMVGILYYYFYSCLTFVVKP